MKQFTSPKGLLRAARTATVISAFVLWTYVCILNIANSLNQ